MYTLNKNHLAYDFAKPILRFKWLFSIILAIFLVIGFIQMQTPVKYFFLAKLKINNTSYLSKAQKNTVHKIIYQFIKSSPIKLNISHNAKPGDFSIFSKSEPYYNLYIFSTEIQNLQKNIENALLTSSIGSSQTKTIEKIKAAYKKQSHFINLASTINPNTIYKSNCLFVKHISMLNTILTNQVALSIKARLLTKNTTKIQTFSIFLIEGLCFGLIACYLIDSIWQEKN